MKNFTISLGIGLNMFFADYYRVEEPVKRAHSNYYDPRGRSKK